MQKRRIVITLNSDLAEFLSNYAESQQMTISEVFNLEIKQAKNLFCKMNDDISKNISTEMCIDVNTI